MTQYIKPDVIVYDATAIKAIQAQARSCSGGAVGTQCNTPTVAQPDSCTGQGTVGVSVGCGGTKKYCTTPTTSKG